MVQNAVIPFPPLPLDISREIFEHAVFCNPADRYSLALISRLVQKWTDPYVFCVVTVSSHPRAERFHATLVRSQKSGRFIQALSYVQTLTIEISWFMMSWDTIVSNFPRLVALYWKGNPEGDFDFTEVDQDPGTGEPRSIPTLRRLIGGYGCNTFCGQWECVQRLTHLDLTALSSRAWSTLGSRGLQFLSSLTHLFACFGRPRDMEAMEQDLRVLIPFFPPSLLVCLMTGGDLDELSEEETTRFSNFVYELDDRLVLCKARNPPAQNQWILELSWSDEHTPWSGVHDEVESYWATGLTMVTERRMLNN